MAETTPKCVSEVVMLLGRAAVRGVEKPGHLGEAQSREATARHQKEAAEVIHHLTGMNS